MENRWTSLIQKLELLCNPAIKITYIDSASVIFFYACHWHDHINILGEEVINIILYKLNNIHFLFIKYILKKKNVCVSTSLTDPNVWP